MPEAEDEISAPGHPRAPAVATSITFIVGAVCDPDLLEGSSPFLALALLLVAAVWAAKRPLFATALVLAGFFLLGASAHRTARLSVESQPLLRLYESRDSTTWTRPVLVVGRLLKEPEAGPDATQMDLIVDRLSIKSRAHESPGGLRVGVWGEARYRRKLGSLHSGDGVQMWARVRRPRGFGNPGSFDVESHYGRNQLTLSGSVKSALLIERSTVAPWWTNLGSRTRAWARRRIEGAYEDSVDPGSEVPGIVLALLVGDRCLIPPWAERLYQSAGTFHVIAISGAHVGLLAWLLYGGLRKAGVGLRRALLVLFMLLPFYASLCGGRPSVVRAVLMCLCVIGTKLLSLDAPGLNGLALSALVLLAMRPLDLRDPGFQLSFGAMTCILLYARPLARTFLSRLGRPGQWLAVTLAAQVGVVPILAWHFMRLTPAAVAANLIAMPLAGALIVVGAGVVILAPVPWIGEGAAWLAWLMVKAVTLSSQWAVSLPGGSIRVVPPEPWWMAAYVLTLGGAAVSRGRWRKAAAAALGLLTVWLAVRPSAPTPCGRVRLTAFDVGHGDALLLELPGNRRILVDGGGSFSRSFDIGESVLVPALLRRGVRDLEAIVLTHPDFDHMGGLPAVISNLDVKEIWQGRPSWELETYRQLRERAQAEGVAVRGLVAGDELVLGEVRLEVLSGGGSAPKPSNENSLVLLVSYGRSRMLLSGDAGAETEAGLLRSARLEPVDVLKVGHHGSRGGTTPAFIEAVRPRLAVISAGGGGLLRLPSPQVLRRLEARGVTTVRTDRDGAITVTLDKEANLRVETFRAAKDY